MTIPTTDETHLTAWYNLREQGNLELRLGMFRTKWPKAYAYLVQHDEVARDIAARRDWIAEAQPLDTSEFGITRNLIKLQRLAAGGKVATALAQFGLAILRKAVATHAPERAHFLPDRITPA